MLCYTADNVYICSAKIDCSAIKPFISPETLPLSICDFQKSELCLGFLLKKKLPNNKQMSVGLKSCDKLANVSRQKKAFGKMSNFVLR